MKSGRVQIRPAPPIELELAIVYTYQKHKNEMETRSLTVSEAATKVVFSIREIVGEKMCGVDLEILIQHDFIKDLEPYEFLEGIEQAEILGFVRVSRMIGQPRPNVPNNPSELRAIAKISILEDGHKYCDHLLT